MSCIGVNDTLSEEFVEEVGVHQGLVLSPYCSLWYLKYLSLEFRSGCPEELVWKSC